MGRLRTNPHAIKLIKESSFLLQKKGKNYFSINRPIYIEVGMGKGGFITKNANLYKEINFIGIEKYATVALKAIKKAQCLEAIDNLKFICDDAKNIAEWFPYKIQKIYLNFSDPWPKKRHASNRLTSPFFQKQFENILESTGLIEFKTDNESLYEYTLKVIRESQDTKLVYFTDDLYANLDHVNNVNNIPTEYETKFVNQGKKIKKIIWQFI